MIDVVKVAGGFDFTEGPLWHPNGYLLFSDCKQNRIWRLNNDGKAVVFREKSGFCGTDRHLLSDIIGSNGLAFDKNHNLVICQQGDHAIAKLDKNNGLEIITHYYDGKPYNSPNDIVVRSDSTIYFTDPPYGLRDQVLNPRYFQPHGGLYQHRYGITTLLDSELIYPNGLCFGPGEQILYLSSNHHTEKRILRFELTDNGNILSKEIFAEVNADGMTTDNKGNILACTNDGVLVLSPGGEKLGLIPVPETVSNIAKAGDSRYFVTARTSVYAFDWKD